MLKKIQHAGKKKSDSNTLSEPKPEYKYILHHMTDYNSLKQLLQMTGTPKARKDKILK